MKTVDELRKMAADKWNDDIPRIEAFIKDSPEKQHAAFMWDAIVWQEILMYIFMKRQVEFDDFHLIVDRRGLDANMASYLKEMLIYLGIGDIFVNSDSVAMAKAVLEAAERKAQEVERKYAPKDFKAE